MIFSILMVSVSLLSAEVVGKFSYKGAPETLNNDTILVSDTMVAMAEKVFAEIQKDENGKNSAIIGEITEDNKGMLIMKTSIGGKRIVDMLAGEQLPRICW